MTFLEPVKLLGQGEYNMDAVEEIKVTDSFLGLSQGIRNCQNVEPLYNCTTRYYKETVLKQCGCIPFNIRLSDKVFCSMLYKMLKQTLLLLTGNSMQLCCKLFPICVCTQIF